jgi:hypothetical protein
MDISERNSRMMIPTTEAHLVKLFADKVYRDSHKESAREYGKQYRNDNRDTLLAKKREYSEAHKEEASVRRKEYYDSNRDKILEQQKEYREAHKEELTEYFKHHHIEHAEEHKQYKREYREKNKEKLSTKSKQLYEDNKDVYLKKSADYIAKRKAEGYSYRTDPMTGKKHWVKSDTPKRKPSLAIPDTEEKLIKYFHKVRKIFSSQGIDTQA